MNGNIPTKSSNIMACQQLDSHSEIVPVEMAQIPNVLFSTLSNAIQQPLLAVFKKRFNK